MKYFLKSLGLALVLCAPHANAQSTAKAVKTDLKAISTFDGTVFTRKRARDILESEGYDYVDHYGCAAWDTCAGDGNKIATVVGLHPTHGMVIHDIAALPCRRMPLAENLTKAPAGAGRKKSVAGNSAEVPLRDATEAESCFGGYRTLRRGIVDWGLSAGGDAWSLRQSILFEWLGPKGWRRGKTLSAIEWQSGLLSRSDGWTEGAAFEIRGAKGRVRAQSSWDGLTLPGGDGSSMSNLERCEVRKNTILKRETFKDQVREEECRSESFLDFVFGGSTEVTAGSPGAGFSAKTLLPGGCDAFDRTAGYAEMIAQDEYDSCVANPDAYFAAGVTTRTPNVIDMMIQSDLLDPEAVEWVQGMSVTTNCTGEETSEREVEVDVDGRKLECTETTTTFYFKDENGSCQSQSSSSLDCGEFIPIK